MNKPKIALLIDLGSLHISCAGYKKLAEEVEKDFDIAYVKFYSYVAKRNRDFNEFIAAKGYDAVTPVASKRRNKLDSRQIIDATKIISLNSTIDAVAFAVGEGDILPILTELKMVGKEVFEIGVTDSSYSEAFSGIIKIETDWLRDGYAAPTTHKAVKKASKKAIQQAEPQVEEKDYANADVKRVLSGQAILDRFKKKN